MKKRILSIILCVVVISSMFPNCIAIERVSYRDEYGNIKYCNDYEIINKEHTTFNASKDMWFIFDGEEVKLPKISFNGSRTFNLIVKDGQNIIIEGGIFIKYGTLVIYAQENGTGRLNAIGDYNVAGIGGNSFKSIIVNGGNISASSIYGAGIGTGYGGDMISDCENITINGGNITAISQSGAGIGAGQGDRFYTSCGNITIANATVDAQSVDGAAIGAGCAGDSDSLCGNIYIKSGKVNAKSTGYGAAIGTGIAGKANSACGNITIDDGMVTAEAKDGAGIGLGWSYRESKCGNITINGGNVITSSVEGTAVGKARFNSDWIIGTKSVATGMLILNGDSSETTNSVETLNQATGKYVHIWKLQSAGGVQNNKPNGTKITKLNGRKKSFSVMWKKQSQKINGIRISGYQIQYATNKNFSKGNKTVTVKGYNKTKKTVKLLKSNKKYYVHIRTYKSLNGVKTYSNWSKSKTVRTK